MTYRSRPVAGLLFLAVACASPTGEQPFVPVLMREAPAAAVVAGPRTHTVAVAEAARVPVFRRPAAEQPRTVLASPDPFGSTLTFLVAEERDDWLRVHLPIRPNGSTGWIRTGRVWTFEHPYRVVIDLDRRQLRAFRDDRLLMSEPVAVGTGGTPTPKGLFYTSALAEMADPNGALGPYVYVLSGYSEVLFSFAGGDGRIAIHGTNAPSSIGQAVSHGCIRMTNEAITKLAKFLPLGTPVRIRP